MTKVSPEDRKKCAKQAVERLQINTFADFKKFMDKEGENYKDWSPELQEAFNQKVEELCQKPEFKKKYDLMKKEEKESKQPIVLGSSRGAMQIAMRRIRKRITDFTSFKDFLKEEKYKVNGWSDEFKSAYDQRIQELREADPEFKEKYDDFEKRRQENMERSKRAIPIGGDRQEEAASKIQDLRAKNRLKELAQRQPKKRSGIFSI